MIGELIGSFMGFYLLYLGAVFRIYSVLAFSGIEDDLGHFGTLVDFDILIN